MKTIALLALLAMGLVAATGCHQFHHRNNYSSGYNSR
jgi:hypothetical protein